MSWGNLLIGVIRTALSKNPRVNCEADGHAPPVVPALKQKKEQAKWPAPENLTLFGECYLALHRATFAVTAVDLRSATPLLGLLVILACGLACSNVRRLRRRIGADNPNLQGGVHIGVETKFHIVIAQHPDGRFQIDLLLVERDVELGLELVGNHAGRDRSEHLTVLTGLDRDQTEELGDALPEFGHGVQLMSLTFGTALLERLQPALVYTRQRDGQSLGNEIVAGIAGGHFDMVGFGTQAYDIVR